GIRTQRFREVRAHRVLIAGEVAKHGETLMPDPHVACLRQNQAHKSSFRSSSRLAPSNTMRPDFSTSARGAIFNVAGMFCSTITTVVLDSRLIRVRLSITSRTMTGARPVDGSSSSKILGFVINA